MIHARLTGVSRTLVLTLRARANENSRNESDRLFADDWSHTWYQWMPQYVDFDAWYTPMFELASNIRTAIMDEITETFIQEHDNPVIVELGGGLSSRPYRIGLERAQWVILDLPSAMSIRYKVDTPSEHLLLIADAINSDHWAKRIPQTDNADYLFIAEDVLVYLDKTDVQAMMANLQESYQGAMFVFDVPRKDYVEREKEAHVQFGVDLQFSMNEADVSAYGLEQRAIDYVLTAYPERWQEIDGDLVALTRENSGFVVTAIV